jgi:hypothetical protein
MSRLVINNRSSAHDLTALKMVESVVQEGRISGRGEKAQYCYLSVFNLSECKFAVVATLNKQSDSFIVTDLYQD